MRAVLWLLVTSSAVAGVGAAASVAAPSGAVYEVEGPVAPLYQAAEQALQNLKNRGWNVRGLQVRFSAFPHDAAAAHRGVVVGFDTPPEEVYYLVTQKAVERELADSPLALVYSHLVAAHLAPPTAFLRQEWERNWQRQLAQGDVVHTLIPELVWRTAHDQGVRVAARLSSWDEVLKLLQRAGLEDPAAAAADLAAAALLMPQEMGFTVPPWRWGEAFSAGGNFTFEMSAPQLRWVNLELPAGGLGVLPIRLRHVAARVVLRFGAGGWEVLPMEAGDEVRLPATGVEQMGVLLVNVKGEASASFALRELEQYPVSVEHVSLQVTGEGVELTWETQRHEDLLAFVVETWAAEGESVRLKRRTVIPAVENADYGFTYAFVGELGENPQEYRLYALTQAGILARLFASPMVGQRQKLAGSD